MCDLCGVVLLPLEGLFWGMGDHVFMMPGSILKYFASLGAFGTPLGGKVDFGTILKRIWEASWDPLGAPV